MIHLGTKSLETDRLLLRQFTIEDSAAVFRNWTNDDRVTKYLCWPTHESQAVTEKIIRDWTAQYKNPAYYQWAIVEKTINEPIGIISAVKFQDDIGSTEIGYCLGYPWWGRGYMPEAFTAVLRFLFEEVGVLRVEAAHDPNNPNSGKVMQKCGLQYEGTLRCADRNNQGIVDKSIYAILAEEYAVKNGAKHGI